jgi:CRP/FNR family transcriptional regulator
MPRLDWTQIPYFESLGTCDSANVEAAARPHVYEPGTMIFHEGDRCAGFFILVEGMVRLYRVNSEGRLHTLSLLKPLATFNEVAAVDGETNPFNATAVVRSVVRVIPHKRLMQLLASEQALLNSYVQALAHRNREYIERLEDMTFRSIPSRLAKLFLHETMYADQIAETPSRLTQEEIAAILGTTREVVGRALRGLMNDGLLQKRGRHVYVVDRAGLERLAETPMGAALLPENGR